MWFRVISAINLTNIVIVKHAFTQRTQDSQVGHNYKMVLACKIITFNVSKRINRCTLMVDS